MLIRFVHAETGREYTIPAGQVVVLTDDGTPAALAYQRGNVIVATDAGQNDFAKVCGELRIVPPAVQVQR